MSITHTTTLLATLETQLGPDPLNPAADLAGISSSLTSEIRRLGGQLQQAQSLAWTAFHAHYRDLNSEPLRDIFHARLDQLQDLSTRLDQLELTQDNVHRGIRRFCEVL